MSEISKVYRAQGGSTSSLNAINFVRKSAAMRNILRDQLLSSSNPETVERAANIVPHDNASTQRSFSNSTLNSALRRWYNMRDDNMHPEVRISIARFFRYTDLQREYRANLRMHHQDGYLSTRVKQRRGALDLELERRIRRTYGDDIWSRVSRNAF